jgi:radical SAM superfamily enzyme YgiQ (UPF0313 family)
VDVEVSRAGQGGQPLIMIEGSDYFSFDGKDLRTLSRTELQLEMDGHLGPVGFGARVPARNRTVAIDQLKSGRPVLCLAGGGALHIFHDVSDRWVSLSRAHLDVLEAVLSGQAPDGVATTVASLAEDLLLVGALVEAGAPLTSVDPSESSGQSCADSRESTAQHSNGPDELRVPPPTIDLADRPHRRLLRGRRPKVETGHAPIPVLSFWATSSGPHLGSAAVVAYARVHEAGELNDVYDFRRAAPAEEVLETIAATSGAAILLCSNYIWSLKPNLATAATAMAANPSLIVIHGGPSTPRYERDCADFLESLGPRHLVINGEGEVTFATVLQAIAPALTGEGRLDLDALRGVAGVRFLDPRSGTMVDNDARERHTDLAEFPSALLSGELDDVDPEIIRSSPLAIETNRGCPYECTFCDWGQATMSRIRKFPLDRVNAELEWLAARGVGFWFVADANFGMLPRDVEITRTITELRERTSFPEWIAVCPPKNVTRRFVEIIDDLLAAGISMKTALALQTRDPATLEAIRRTNIGTQTYDDLAHEVRRRGLPLTCDLMLGLPGSTVNSFKGDLQWCMDNEIRAFMYSTFVLPNAPMNDPDYRAEHGIVTVDGLITEVATMDAADRHLVDRIAYGYVLFECLGILRYVLRFLQWDHGLRSTDVIERIVLQVDANPGAYPLLAWQLTQSDLMLLPSVGWKPFFDEVRRFLVAEFGVPDQSDLDVALEANRFLLPAPGRRFPDSIELEHDYAAYFDFAHRALAQEGVPCAPSTPLRSRSAGRLTVLADPDDRCEAGFGRLIRARKHGTPSNFWVTAHLELVSPLATYLPLTSAFVEARRELARDQAAESGEGGRPIPVPVQVRRD